MILDPATANWSQMSDEPKTVDPEEAACARVLGFATGAAPDYCRMVVRDFLPLYRHMERQKEPPVVPQLLARKDERVRIGRLIRERLGNHLRYIDTMDSREDILRAASAACALQAVLDEIDPPAPEPAADAAEAKSEAREAA